MRMNPLKYATLGALFLYGHNNHDWSSKCTTDLCRVTEAASVPFVVGNKVCSIKRLQIVNQCKAESNAELPSSTSGLSLNPRCADLMFYCINADTGTQKRKVDRQ